jgi:adenosyl cobinamide kinase/adenosyl cobinamide phosphate guanylyltransferase
LAVSLAQATEADVLFVATARPDDEEMTARIAHHRRSRPDTWTTSEAPIDLVGAVRSASPGETIVIDCITLWISNLMTDLGDDEIVNLTAEVTTAIEDHAGQVIVVSNEVGLGLVPIDPVGRRFRDLQGRVNQSLSRAATDTYLVVAGRTLRLGTADVP